MKVYYKGNLIKNLLCPRKVLGQLSHSIMFNDKKIVIYEDFVPSSIKDTFNYYAFNRRNDEGTININNPDIFTLFYQISSTSKELIFEIVEDINGNFYGKELITNCLFPIVSTNNFNCLLKWTLKNNLVSIEDYKITLTNPNLKEATRYLLDIPEHRNSLKLANQNEVTDYLNQFKKGFRHEHKLINFQEQMQRLANQNIYSQEITLKEPKIMRKLKPSQETIIMENIEFLLLKLKKENSTSYELLNQEYQNILNSANTLTTTPLVLQTLISLEAKIEACFFNQRRNIISLLDYINKLVLEYLNQKETKLTFQDIFKLNDLFIKQKGEYSLVNQRLFQRNISILYFFELYEQKDNLDIEELNNTYIVDNLKTIIIVINTFQEENILIYDYYLDLNNISLDSVINLIKSIKFTKNSTDKIKKLLY